MARGNDVILRDIAWSTDGRYLAFAGNATGDFDLFVWEVASGELTQLTDTPDRDEIAPVWRPIVDDG